MTEILETLAMLSVLVFVIGSMGSMGLSLKMAQIVAPLKNAKLVILALLANFILIPAIAYLITLVMPLDECIPYPVDRPLYDQTIELLERAIRKAKLGQTDELRALRRLERYFGDC